MKSKIKKQHSDAKMALPDTKKQLLIEAIVENGTDWDAVAAETEQSAELCQKQFSELSKEIRKKETAYKKNVMGTGGGPPPSDNDEDPLNKLKKIIEPQIDGMWTVYDDDALLMKKYQDSIPEKDRTVPIENNFDNTFIVPMDEEDENITEDNKSTQVSYILDKSDIHQETPKRIDVRPQLNRTEILKKRKSSALICNDKSESGPKPKKNVKESFTDLSEAKLELVNLQKESIKMEMEHKKWMHDFEIKEKIKESNHKDEVREKELLLLDLKIKQLSK